MKRWWRFRVIVPLKRSKHSPNYVARGVGVGLFWALTPTVGVQMAMVLVHWLVVRRLHRWDFNVVHAMAWTWVTNVFTLLPIYYLFYVTGQMMLGRFDDLTGYNGFLRLWDTAFGTADDGSYALGGIEAYKVYFSVIVEGWGLALLTGCVPYAFIGSWVGYSWALKVVIGYRNARQRHRMHRAAAHSSDGMGSVAEGGRAGPASDGEFS